MGPEGVLVWKFRRRPHPRAMFLLGTASGVIPHRSTGVLLEVEISSELLPDEGVAGGSVL